MDKLDKTLPAELQDIKIGINGKEADSDIAKGSANPDDSQKDSRAGIVISDGTDNAEQKTENKEKKSMANEVTLKEIQKEVEAIMAAKDSAKQVEDKIASLEASKAALTDKLDSAKAANDTLQTELDAVKAELETQKAEATTANDAKVKAEEQAAKATTQLEAILAEQTLASRQNELKDANLLFAEGDKRDKQLSKVKVMSEEVFASYKEELIDVLAMATSKNPDDSSEGEDNKSNASEDMLKDKKKPENAAQASGSDDEKFDKALASITNGIDPAQMSDGSQYQAAIAAASQQVNLDESNVNIYAQM